MTKDKGQRTNPRILLIKPSALGDVVHALPALKLVRRRWPGAHVAWLVQPKFADLLRGRSDLDAVHLFRRDSPGSVAGLVGELRRAQFDLTIDLQGLSRTAWLGYLSGTRWRAGFAGAREMAGWLYNVRAGGRAADGHAVDRNLALARRLGCRGPAEFDFALSPADHAAAAALVPGRPYAVLLPGTNWETKRWPIGHFAALAAALPDRLGLTPIVCGGPGDAALARQVGARDLTGRTPLKTLAAVLAGAALVVANDSGPMHIAAALGVPLVVPFGPTDARRTGPYRRPECVVRLDLPCAPCYSRHCAHRSCLTLLAVEAVMAAAERQMGAGQPVGTVCPPDAQDSAKRTLASAT